MASLCLKKVESLQAMKKFGIWHIEGDFAMEGRKGSICQARRVHGTYGTEY